MDFGGGWNKGTESIPLKKVDDGKVKGLLLTAESLNALHKAIVTMYEEGIDTNTILGYSDLVKMLDKAYSEHFGG